MTSESIDTYVRRLQRELRSRGLLRSRFVEEAREHLIDAIDDGVRRGLSRPAAEREAFARFGDPNELGAEFQQVYRWDYLLWYLAKITASVAASVAVALVIQVVVNLRLELQAEALRLAPGFSKAALVSVAIVVGLATAWEIARRPFDTRRASIAIVAYAAICAAVQLLFAAGLQAFGPATLLVGVGYLCSRLDRRPARLLLTFCVFAALLYAAHLGADAGFGATRALTASAAILAIWTSTVAILSRLDHAFLNVFGITERG